jgi:hypothetical protein
MSKNSTRRPKLKSFADSKFANDVRSRAAERKIEIEVAKEAAGIRRPDERDGIKGLLRSLAHIKNVLALNQVAPGDQLLEEVFAFCHLDPTDPWHWRILLEVTIAAAFKRSGAHEKWNEASLFEMHLDVRKAQKLYPAAETNGKIAVILKKPPFKAKYGGMELSYLTKLVGKSRDPRLNPMIAYSDRGDFLEDLVRQRSEQHKESSEMVRSWIDKLVAQQIEEAMTWHKEQFEAKGVPWTEAEREKLLPEISELVRASLAKKDV